jgi:DNA-binding CsgD family transcriptional regulator
MNVVPAGFTSGPYYRRAAPAYIHRSMDGRESLSRLTEREKVCLRQWLQHKSAKEIAVDLGISHHAVEKRLKMARTKLGATSSLQAARMLGEAEGYGQAVP